MEKLLMLEKNM